ncbi:hypothetical protein H6P81_019332 [Aristolochia fimbriata]|uniref:SBP-type domain-containing protein n=1 Tax=Aristolochia fimbriata TaxID=158543 RepID=A0AAV7DV49_ARIFI|nr:hypothetical protein H6P81_019332 [Aristolochia fimbriata]
MESWSCSSEGKGSMLADEIVSTTDALGRTRRGLAGWDLKTPCSYDTSMLATVRESINNRGYMELGLSENVRKSVPTSTLVGFSGNKTPCGRVESSSCSSHLLNPKTSFIRDDESGGSVVDSNSRGDSSLIDLKLGRLADYRDGKIDKSLKDSRDLPSTVVSSVPPKRGRSATLSSQTPFCQVHGCNMDLSSSKDYHKRHKVCEVHSKTAKVIVNGIEQRFCQQCSRFHLLAEFDDGKRSCRKRLAGHNERRRKPQLDTHSGKNGKILASYHGGRYPGTAVPARTSFIFPDIFPSGILREVKYENSDLYRHVKLEDEPLYNNQSSVSFLPPYTTEKQFSNLDTAPTFLSFNNSNRYPNYLTDQPVSRSLLHKTSLGGDPSVYDVASSVQGLSGVSDTGCALSLLSSQSQISTSHSSAIPLGRPLFAQHGAGPPQGPSHYNMTQFSDKLLAMSSQGSTSVASNRFSSSGLNSMEDDHLGALLVSDASNAVDFDTQADGMFQGVDYIGKDQISHGQQVSTVDLLQLSSQLQSMDHHSGSVHVKQENDVFMTSTSPMWL